MNGNNGKSHANGVLARRRSGVLHEARLGSIERRLRILVLPLTRPLALAVYLRPGDKRPV